MSNSALKLFAVAAFALALMGCSSVQKAMVKPEIVAQVNIDNVRVVSCTP